MNENSSKICHASKMLLPHSECDVCIQSNVFLQTVQCVCKSVLLQRERDQCPLENNEALSHVHVTYRSLFVASDWEAESGALVHVHFDQEDKEAF